MGRFDFCGFVAFPAVGVKIRLSRKMYNTSENWPDIEDTPKRDNVYVRTYVL